MEKYKHKVSENRALKKYFDISLGGRRESRIEKEVCTEDVHNFNSSVYINALHCLSHERLVGQMRFIDWK